MIERSCRRCGISVLVHPGDDPICSWCAFNGPPAPGSRDVDRAIAALRAAVLDAQGVYDPDTPEGRLVAGARDALRAYDADDYAELTAPDEAAT